MYETDLNLLFCFSTVVSGALTFTLYKLFRQQKEAAYHLKAVQLWQPGLDLTNHIASLGGQTLDYGAVTGSVQELKGLLQSHHGKQEGVILKLDIVEHKINYDSGFRSDTKRVIYSDFDSLPFTLINATKPDASHGIEVTVPDQAAHIWDSLETTFYKFEPNKDRLSRLFGEFTKGIEIREQMLLTGAQITGVGKMVLANGQIKMVPPDDPRLYILTKVDLNELANDYEVDSFSSKIFAILAACLTGSLFLCAVYRFVKQWLERRRLKQMFDDVRRSVAEHQQNIQNIDRPSQASGSEPDDNMCVVCLTNVCQVIAIPCQHFAMCITCAETLPSPKRCPLCRANIEYVIPLQQP